ncbi:MAG: protein kinase, partial [Coriobacteriales bacterium]|nr:protein kinase [Coriobacteriales bacterium]
MPTVVVDRVATGIRMTKAELERALTDVRRAVVEDERGNLRHVQGGEAVIWRAGQSGEYVIKAFRDDTESRAEPEFEKLLLLQPSRYVPKAYGFGRLVEDDGVEHRAIVEEYIRGVSLAKLVTSGKITGDVRNRRLSAMDTALIVLELTRGIRELKRVGLAHRDISCRNVLIRNACVDERFVNGVDLCFIDFGTSTYVTRKDATALGSGVRLATIPFGAPEMFGGRYRSRTELGGDLAMPGRESSLTDVWSVGAIIVFLMWGEYWPQEIEDIHRRQLASVLTVGFSETRRIAEAKERSIEL